MLNCLLNMPNIKKYNIKLYVTTHVARHASYTLNCYSSYVKDYTR